MEKKKSSAADLERKRYVFFALGLLLSSSFVWMCFSFKGVNDYTARQETVFESSDDERLDEIVEQQQEEEIPEPEVVPPPPAPVDEVEEVEDDIEVETDFSSMDTEVPELVEDVAPVIEEEPIVDFAEVDPAFPGGEGKMAEFIQKNVQYPAMSIEMGEQGKVYVEFVVNKNGSIEQVKVVRGISDALDSEAKRVVKSMPKWSPGEQAGKPVRVRFTIPIHFRLG